MQSIDANTKLVHATWDYTAANAIAVPAAEVAQVEETGVNT